MYKIKQFDKIRSSSRRPYSLIMWQERELILVKVHKLGTIEIMIHDLWLYAKLLISMAIEHLFLVNSLLKFLPYQ